MQIIIGNSIGVNRTSTLGGGPFSNTKSLSFDGVDEYVSANKLNLTTAISVSCWVKTTSTATQWLVNEDRTSGTDRNWALLIAGNQINFIVWHTDGTNTQLIRSTALEVQDGNWHHILVTWDGTTNANQFKSFVDGGNEESKTATSTGIRNLSPYGLAIASVQQNAGFRYSGNLDEVAIWNSDQSANVSTIYNGGEPNNLSDLNPLAWYRMGDNSTYQTPQILMPENTNKDKVSNYSLTFDGVDDYISIGTTSLGITSAITISCWVKTTDTSFVFRSIVAEDTTSVSSRNWNLLLNSNNKIGFIFYNTDGSTNYLVRTTALEVQDGNWHHIAATYNGTTDADGIKIYIDGGNVETLTALSTGIRSTSSVEPTIGSNTNGSWNFEGNIDEVSVYSSALTPEQITSIFNGGEPTTISGATAYWKLGEQSKFTDNWLVPNSALNNYSKYSFNFDGVDDYIVCSYDSSLNVVTANHSLSFWIKTTDGTTQVVCEKGSGDELAAWITTSKITWAGPNTFSSTSTINDGNWHHIGFVADGLNSYIYIDGSLDNTGGNKIQASANFSPFVFGARSGGSFAFLGNLDELAIFNYALSSDDINTIYNGGEPTTIPSGAVAHWRMGENATYNSSTSEWTIPDQVGSNDGTSTNTMALDTLVGEAPNYFGGGLSDAMTIEDRVGDAPNSSNNSVSFNMEAEDINNNVPT